MALHVSKCVESDFNELRPKSVGNHFCMGGIAVRLIPAQAEVAMDRNTLMAKRTEKRKQGHGVSSSAESDYNARALG